jgi:cell division protein FtsB
VKSSPKEVSLLKRWKKIIWVSAFLFLFFANRGFRLLTRNWMELHKLKTREAQLKTSLKEQTVDWREISNNPEVIESRARKELDFIKKGEIEYRFTPPQH